MMKMTRGLKWNWLGAMMLSVLVLTGAAQGWSQEVATIDQVDTVTVMSAKMGRAIKNVVIVPAQYFDNDLQDVDYAVVYLLHGYGGDYSNWIKKKPELEDIASEKEMIIVCPDGQDSWYWDSPIDGKMQFETYIVNELVPYIDQKYRTRKEARSRAITGLSMGGQGGLWLGWRHPDVWGQCGSMSGGLDVTAFSDKWKKKDRLGDYEANKERWAQYNVLGLVPGLTNGKQRIIIDCGSEDFMLPANVAMHDALLKQGIGHDFTVRPGNHNWDYWNNAVDYQLLFFSKGFESIENAGGE